MTKEDRDYMYIMEGKELEKSGDIEGAITIYEKLLSRNFDGSYPYDRLCVIYRKKKDFFNEKRVLEKAIKIFTKIVAENLRGDGLPKFQRYNDRLTKLLESQKTNK